LQKFSGGDRPVHHGAGDRRTNQALDTRDRLPRLNGLDGLRIHFERNDLLKGGFGIGCGHFVHAMRRNINLTYMVLDNQIYGLTTGQTSPTSRIGMKTKSNPYGNADTPVNPLTLALSAGATFVGRGFSGDQKHLTELIKSAIQHKGFSFLDIFSPCVTYNKDNTFQWFRPRVKKLEDNPEYDSTNWIAAMEKATVWGDEIPIGKFYETNDIPTLEETEPVLEAGPMISRDLYIPADVAKKFVEELM